MDGMHVWFLKILAVWATMAKEAESPVDRVCVVCSVYCSIIRLLGRQV